MISILIGDLLKILESDKTLRKVNLVNILVAQFVTLGISNEDVHVQNVKILECPSSIFVTIAL